MRSFQIASFFLLAALVSSCGYFWNYRGLSELKNFEWKKSEPQTFSANLEKGGPNDVWVLFRHVHGFPYKDVGLVLHTVHGGDTISEELTIPIIGDDRDYLGQGSGDIWDVEYMVESERNFEAGEYTFILEHRMEKETLNLVMEVGVMLTSPTED